MNVDYTLVVTACGRDDLLRMTLESFYEHADEVPREAVVIEDSDAPMPEFLADDAWRQRGLKWLSNGGRRGQLFSINRAYAEVRTELLMHGEDDWLFVRRTPIAESAAILARYPRVFTVGMRGAAGQPLCSATEIDPAAAFMLVQPYWMGVWGGLTFNFGLRRMADYLRIGSYSRHASRGEPYEAKLSKMMLDMGYRIADFGEEIARHIGDGRSCSPR